MKKGTIYWITAVLLMFVAAYWQRVSGPTYPKSEHITIANEKLNFTLLRSYDSGDDAPITIIAKKHSIQGFLHFKRYNSNESWETISLLRNGDTLSALLPTQPKAGKLHYYVSFKENTEEVTCSPVIIRFKGAVPAGVLIPHILLMFLAMVFSLRTGIEVFTLQKNTTKYTIFTLLFLILGGLILGPIVQRYAFDTLWAGFPFDYDLTDNKTLIAALFWVVALIALLKKKRYAKKAVIIACVVLLLIYMIPHSLFGSEFDYDSGTITTATQHSDL